MCSVKENWEKTDKTDKTAFLLQFSPPSSCQNLQCEMLLRFKDEARKSARTNNFSCFWVSLGQGMPRALILVSPGSCTTVKVPCHFECLESVDQRMTFLSLFRS